MFPIRGGLNQRGYDLDKSCFSGAVRTNQTEDLAGADFE